MGFQLLPLNDLIECSGTIGWGEMVWTRVGHENVLEAVGVAVRSQSACQDLALDYAIYNLSGCMAQRVLLACRCHKHWPGTRAHR